MKRRHLVRSQEAFGAFRRMLLTLCFFFVCGAALGLFLGGMTGDRDAQLLKEYIVQCASICARGEDTTASVLSVLSVYLRYPLAVFFFGLSVAGMLLIPATILLQGFSVAFSVMCFSAALGRDGLLLALIALGLRTLLVLPVTLLLSVDSLRRSLLLLGDRKSPSGKRVRADGEARYLKLFSCLLLLLLGTATELLIVPKLLQLALAGL